MASKTPSPAKPQSRYRSVGTGDAAVILPKKNLVGKARSLRPGSDLDRGATISNTLARYTANAINTVASKTDVTDIIRTLAREDGLFSSAANSMVALSTGPGFRILGSNGSSVPDIAVTAMAYNIIDQIDMQHDYSLGYNDKPGFYTLLAMLQMDVVISGGCGGELVLDQSFGPERIVPIGYSTIDWKADGSGGRYPTQDGGKIELNIPTVFIGEHNRNPDEAYAASLLRPGLSHTINFNSFLEDTHRTLNRTGHSRLIATILADKIRTAADEKTRQDPALMAKLYTDVKAGVQEGLAALEPEDAIVAFDSVEFDVQDTGGNKSDYTGMLETLGNLLGAALKTPASVSGLRASGGQGLSNAETLIYLKVVQATRPPVEEVISRALTLASRLNGQEGTISFEFMPMDLRPESELEAYRATKQKRILEQLSFGIINEAQACYELGIRPQGLTAILAGTGFYSNAKSAVTDPTATDRSTSTGAAAQPDTPAQPGGSN